MAYSRNEFSTLKSFRKKRCASFCYKMPTGVHFHQNGPALLGLQLQHAKQRTSAHNVNAALDYNCTAHMVQSAELVRTDDKEDHLNVLCRIEQTALPIYQTNPSHRHLHTQRDVQMTVSAYDCVTFWWVLITVLPYGGQSRGRGRRQWSAAAGRVIPTSGVIQRNYETGVYLYKQAAFKTEKETFLIISISAVRKNEKILAIDIMLYTRYTICSYTPLDGCVQETPSRFNAAVYPPYRNSPVDLRQRYPPNRNIPRRTASGAQTEQPCR